MKGLRVVLSETNDGLQVSFTFSHEAKALPPAGNRKAELCAFLERSLQQIEHGRFNDIGHATNDRTVVRRDDWLIETRKTADLEK